MRKYLVPILFVSTGALIAATQLTYWEEEGDESKEAPNDTLVVESYVPSVSSIEDYGLFNYHEHTYLYDSDLDILWESYLNSSPSEIWKGPINNLLLHRSPTGDFESDKISEGSRLLLRLDLFKNRPLKVLFEITKIDSENKKIEFCYDKSNITKGIQILSFYSEEFITHVKHETYYKSDSKIRDKIYPRYHKKCIDELHAAIHNRLLTSEPEIIM